MKWPAAAATAVLNASRSAEGQRRLERLEELLGRVAELGQRDDAKGPTMLVIEPATGQGAYMISLNLPHDTADAFVEAFLPTLSLD